MRVYERTSPLLPAHFLGLPPPSASCLSPPLLSPAGLLCPSRSHVSMYSFYTPSLSMLSFSSLLVAAWQASVPTPLFILLSTFSHFALAEAAAADPVSSLLLGV